MVNGLQKVVVPILYSCFRETVHTNFFSTNHQLKVWDVFILGILKAVHGAQSSDHNRVTKDVVAFYAGDFPDLVEKLQLDLHEPPISQVVFQHVMIEMHLYVSVENAVMCWYFVIEKVSYLCLS